VKNLYNRIDHKTDSNIDGRTEDRSGICEAEYGQGRSDLAVHCGIKKMSTARVCTARMNRQSKLNLIVL